MKQHRLLIALAQIRQRRRMEAAGVQMPLKMWLFPWLSYAVVVAFGGVLLLLASMPGQRATLTLSTLTAVAVFAALWLHRTRKAGAPAIPITSD